MNNRILGRGENGLVVRPPIGYDDPTMVGKIGKYEDLSQEFKIIKLLPERGPYLYDKVYIDIVDKQELSLLTDIFEEIDKSENIYQLITPFVEGKPLDKFMDSDDLFIGSINEWAIHIQSLLRLRTDILKLKRNGIEHRDVHSGNIIFNGNNMTLIDFGSATKGNTNDNFSEDEEYVDNNSIDKIILDYFNSIRDKKILVDMILNNQLATVITTPELIFKIKDKKSIIYDNGNIIGIKINTSTKHSNREIYEYILDNPNDNKKILKYVFEYSYDNVYHFIRINLENIKEYF